MKIFALIGKGFKGLGRLFLPMLSKAPAGAKRRPVLQWILRLLILSLILVGLWRLNIFLGLDRYVRAPRNFLRQLWLPLLFLLFYILCWLGWSLWKLVGPDQLTSSFPDIDQAWDEAVVALGQAGIELNEAPLFLIWDIRGAERNHCSAPLVSSFWSSRCPEKRNARSRSPPARMRSMSRAPAHRSWGSNPSF